MTCDGCGTFWSPGQSEGVIEGCPTCGKRPYEDQPSPIHSEMELRDMPSIDMPNQPDQGGNPLGEGTFGHSDPMWRRDESYASVIPPDRHAGYSRSSIMEASMDEFPFHIEQVIEPGTHTVEVDMGGDQPVVLQNKDPHLLEQAKNELSRQAGLFSMLGTGLGALIGGPEGALAGHTIGGLVGGVLGMGSHAMGASQNAATNETSQMQGPIPSDTEGLVQAPGQQIAASSEWAQSWDDPNSEDYADPWEADRWHSDFVSPETRRVEPGNRFVGGLARMARIVGADYDSPSSVSIIPQKEDTGDPEDVDPHELNDGDHDTWQKENDINDIGGSQENTYAGFDPQGHGVKVLEMTLPLLRHYHEQGPGSGANDPMIQALDAILEGELPGYKDHPENVDQNLLQAILDLAGDKDGSDEDPTALPDVDKGIVEEKDDEHEPKDEAGDHGEDDDRDANDIEKESSVKLSKCAACNAVSNFPLGMCFNCGADAHQKTAGGPSNPEQFKAVADLLRSQGRENEIPSLIDDPDAFTQELLEIQHQQQISPPDEGGLTQEAPMPEEQGDQPGAGMPMPPPPTGQQPMASVRTALHPVQCPKCNSHTTTILDTESGYSQCHTCGHKFDTNLEPSDGHSTHHDVTAASEDNPTDVDAADQEHQVIPSGDAAGHLTWVDTQGSPLQVGQTYLVYSPKYKIPDRQLITAVKPHSYTYEQTGEYGISHANEITKQEADMDGLQFVPADEPGDEELGTHSLEENEDYAGGEGVDPNEQTDISDSSEYQHAASFDPNFNPAGNWLMQEDGMPHTAGKNYTSWEQRELIMEPGVARNLDKLDIANTHYDPEWRRDGDDEFLW